MSTNEHMPGAFGAKAASPLRCCLHLLVGPIGAGLLAGCASLMCQQIGGMNLQAGLADLMQAGAHAPLLHPPIMSRIIQGMPLQAP